MSRLIFLKYLLIIVGFTAGNSTFSQRQLVVTNGKEVIHRFNLGDKFHSKLNSDKGEHWGFLVEVNEFNIITSQDTIQLNEVRKVLLPGLPLIHRIGRTLVKVGLVYLVADQFNWTVIQGHDFSMEKSVWLPSSIMVGSGLPFVFVKRKWGKVGKRVYLRSVGPESKLFVSN